jgi:hypothetical protein
MSVENDVLFNALRTEVLETKEYYWDKFGSITTLAYANAYERQKQLLDRVKNTPFPESFASFVFSVAVSFAGGAIAARMLRGLTPQFKQAISGFPKATEAVSLETSKTVTKLIQGDPLVADWVGGGLEEAVVTGVQLVPSLLTTAQANTTRNAEPFEPPEHSAIVKDKVYDIQIRDRALAMALIIRFLGWLLADPGQSPCNGADHPLPGLVAGRCRP